MKKLTLVTSAILCFALYSCDSPARFDEPQPTGEPKLSSIPSILKGEFASSDSTYFLFINDQYIIRKYYSLISFKRDSLDKGLLIQNNVVEDTVNHQAYSFQAYGDSIVIRDEFSDTLFAFDQEHAIKKYKGYYFVNRKDENAGWELFQLVLKGRELSISSVTNIQHLEELQASRTDTSDTAHKIYHLEKKQFKHFLRHDGFGNTAVYYRTR